MKDLDRSQVYDLRGISIDKIEELHDWLVENDGLVTTLDMFIVSIQEERYLGYEKHYGWILGRFYEDHGDEINKELGT